MDASSISEEWDELGEEAAGDRTREDSQTEDEGNKEKVKEIMDARERRTGVVLDSVMAVVQPY